MLAMHMLSNVICRIFLQFFLVLIMHHGFPYATFYTLDQYRSLDWVLPVMTGLAFYAPLYPNAFLICLSTISDI